MDTLFIIMISLSWDLFLLSTSQIDRILTFNTNVITITTCVEIEHLKLIHTTAGCYEMETLAVSLELKF